MASFLQIPIAMAAIAIIFWVVWSLLDSLKTPVRPGQSTGVTTVVTAQGNGEGLEQTLKSLIWLQENGTVPGQIILADAGLNEEGKILTRLIVKKYTGVVVCNAEEVAQWIVTTATHTRRTTK